MRDAAPLGRGRAGTPHHRWAAAPTPAVSSAASSRPTPEDARSGRGSTGSSAGCGGGDEAVAGPNPCSFAGEEESPETDPATTAAGGHGERQRERGSAAAARPDPRGEVEAGIEVGCPGCGGGGVVGAARGRGSCGVGRRSRAREKR